MAQRRKCCWRGLGRGVWWSLNNRMCIACRILYLGKFETFMLLRYVFMRMLLLRSLQSEKSFFNVLSRKESSTWQQLWI